ncbi:MAG: aldo/keto reductase [Succinivibrio sp.]|nr:aldo/keto reductase [Succinivibrio sp.]
MEFKKLNNGLMLPVVGFGTWNVRNDIGRKTLLKALECGYRLIDTATMYQNENIVGKAIKESQIPRQELFITSKIYRPDTSYKSAYMSIERSLNELQTDYLDLILIHEPYKNSTDMYEAMIDAYNKGLVKALGVSNFSKEYYLNFIKEAKVIPSVNQVESHVYYPQLKLNECLKEYGTIMQSWGSFTEGRKEIFKEPVLVELGLKHHKSSAQIALRYLVQNGIAVIPKSSTASRMKENLEIFDFNLDESDLKKIETLDTGKSLFNWYS